MISKFRGLNTLKSMSNSVKEEMEEHVKIYHKEN